MDMLPPHDNDLFKKALDYGDFKSLRLLLKERELADIAEAFNDIENSERMVIFRLLPRSRRADFFSHLDFERQEELLDELPDAMVTALLNEMEPDNRTKLLEEVSLEIRNKILLRLNPEERQVAWALLSYPEGSVGRLMTPDFVALDANMTVSQGLSYIRWSTALPADYLTHLFVIEDSGRLIGEVSLVSMVLCDPPSLQVRDIMKRNFVTLNPLQEAGEAVEFFRKYDANFIPVVDEDKRLLGMVTSDDVFDVAEEEATEDIQQFGGHSALDGSYFNTPFWTMFRKRAGWLVVLFVSGFISGSAIKNYEELLTEWGFLVFFLTALNSAGGNSGTQTASLIIRGLAIKEIALKDVWRVLAKEAAIGLSLGIVLAVLTSLRAFYWGLGIKIALTIAVVVTLVVILGVLTGSMLPFLFTKLKLDPAVVSSPFISTIMDLTGVLLLFNIVQLAMRFFGLP